MHKSLTKALIIEETAERSRQLEKNFTFLRELIESIEKNLRNIFKV